MDLRPTVAAPIATDSLDYGDLSPSHAILDAASAYSEAANHKAGIVAFDRILHRAETRMRESSKSDMEEFQLIQDFMPELLAETDAGKADSSGEDDPPDDPPNTTTISRSIAPVSLPGAAATEPVEQEVSDEYLKDQALTELREVKVQIAPAADVNEVTGIQVPNCRHIKAEFGVNMLVPVGRVEEMRLRFRLTAEPSDGSVTVIDGFPTSEVTEKPILPVQISIGLTDFLKFIPVPGLGAALPNIVLGPWAFNLGALRQARVLFMGSLNSEPEWYFTRDRLMGEFRVAVSLRFPDTVRSVNASAQAVYRYRSRFWHSDLYTDAATISVM